MQIHKIKHSCVVVETGKTRILVDPGNLSIEANEQQKNIDAVLFTHEHGDHLHLSSLQNIIDNNPQATVVCNSGVGAHLREANIPFQCVEGTATAEVAGVTLQARDSKHAEIFADFGQVQHTGYLIDDRLFLAGDSYEVPEFPVEILAVAVVAPFCALRDALNLIQAIQPKAAIALHDGQLNEAGLNTWHSIAKRVLDDSSTTYVPLAADARYEVIS
jgi:L-ascorbate metabolism protein UlaG (beta-lactamase superfamily)